MTVAMHKATTEVYCAVPENIHTPPTEGTGISWGMGGSVRPKNLTKCMKYNWNFQRGGGLRKKSLPWGRYGYFLESHIVSSFARAFKTSKMSKKTHFLQKAPGVNGLID